MNIVLIHPYINNLTRDSFLSEPLGLLCLATYIEQKFSDVTVDILDLYADGASSPIRNGKFWTMGVSDPTEIARRLKALQPDLIGIHCNFTAYADDSLEVAQVARDTLHDVPIVIGGAHPTIEGEAILEECPAVDIVARGDGELILANIVRMLKGEISIEEIPGVSYRRFPNETSTAAEIISNPPQPLMDSLDDLPIPSRKYIDMDRYKNFNKKTIWYVKNSPVATIMTSRGCPYDCVFCSTKVVWERNWRFRSLENIFAEIEQLHRDYGIREFVINDDQFMTQRKRVHAFCDYFIEKKLDIFFSVDAGLSVWLVDVAILAKMKRAGFYALRFPIETGSKKTLKYVNKPVNLDKARTMIAEANKLRFWISANIIVGFPDETRADVLESIQYVYDSSLDFTSFLIAKPNAGAKLYEDMRDKGLLGQNVVRGSDFYHSDYDTIHLTAQELTEIVNRAHGMWFSHKLKFYLKPHNFIAFLLPKLRTRDGVRYSLRVFTQLIKRKLFPALQQSLRGITRPARGLEINN